MHHLAAKPRYQPAVSYKSLQAMQQKSSICAITMATPTLLIIFLLAVGTEFAGAVQMAIKNNCPYTIWAASLNPGGGRALTQGQTWILAVPAGTKAGRIWGRTGCNFGSGNGQPCATGDCGDALVCSAGGATPASLVEYTLNGGSDQNEDFYDLSLVDGFNLPVSISPTKPGGSPNCRAISCAKDLNAGCPAPLKVAGSAIGCKSACDAFPNRDDFCCRGKYGSGPSACPPSPYASYFKRACPDAYSYAYDDKTSTFTCPSGSTDYDIVFCP